MAASAYNTWIRASIALFPLPGQGLHSIETCRKIRYYESGQVAGCKCFSEKGWLCFFHGFNMMVFPWVFLRENAGRQCLKKPIPLSSRSPVLYIFSGLPGAGKTTLARKLAGFFHIPFFRLDTIEHGLREICSVNVQGEGYSLTGRIVAENLQIGNDVVVDCCNPWRQTRDEWENTALRNGGRFINIEVVCSDLAEHKKRVTERESDIPGFAVPTWEDVSGRDYQTWETERICVDTRRKGVDDAFQDLLAALGESPLTKKALGKLSE